MSQGLSTPPRSRRAATRGKRSAAAPRQRATTAPERGAARDALLAAARKEFDEAGFEGTDTNRIARRAGYAPQTFYRHFHDKTAIFVEIYNKWFEDEWKDLEKAHGKGADGAARVLLDHHARHREFRRSLRRLTVTDETVRAARTASRRHQLELVDAEDKLRGHKRETALRIALLFCTERLADAAADGELSDLGLSHEEQVALLADVLRRLRSPRGPGSTR